MNKKIMALSMIFILVSVSLGCVSRTYSTTETPPTIVTPVQENIPETTQKEIPQTPPPPITPPPTTTPQTIRWNEARSYIGDRLTVYGPVAGTRYASSSRGRPTFINLGRDFPDPNRFTVVIWEGCRPNFSTPPEVLYRGKNIYVTGLVTQYQGVPQIEVCYPYQIRQQ